MTLPAYVLQLLTNATEPVLPVSWQAGSTPLPTRRWPKRTGRSTAVSLTGKDDAMNARLRADLYAAGITSPHLLAHCIDHATQRAAPAPRLTPSRRYRRWKVIAVRIAVVAAVFAIYGATR